MRPLTTSQSTITAPDLLVPNSWVWKSFNRNLLPLPYISSINLLTSGRLRRPLPPGCSIKKRFLITGRDKKTNNGRLMVKSLLSRRYNFLAAGESLNVGNHFLDRVERDFFFFFLIVQPRFSYDFFIVCTIFQDLGSFIFLLRHRDPSPGKAFMCIPKDYGPGGRK